MKIAMVSEHASPLAPLGSPDTGGQNVHVGALAAALAERGHDVTIYTRRDDPTVPARVPLSHKVCVEHVPAGPPEPVFRDHLLSYIPDFGAYLADRFTTERPDLVHAHFWMSGLAALQAARDHGLPVVQTFHALGTVKRRHQGAADTSPPERVKLERAIGRAVAHVIASCEDEVQELRRMGIGYGRMTVVPSGVDLERFQPRLADFELRPAPRLLSIGRLVERKGVDDVVRALAKVANATLIIAGGAPLNLLAEDPDAMRLRAVVDRLGVRDRVTFLGQVPHDEVPDLMRSVDLVVCAPWYEPFGIVPVEAMACGVPVVGTAVGGLKDTVLPGVTGELVPPRSPDHLAYALRRLLNDPVRLQAYRFAAADRARAAFSWERVAVSTEQVYRRVLGVADVPAAPVGTAQVAS
jgi:glycosyltransferase involved in cell wall biosynthesis